MDQIAQAIETAIVDGRPGGSELASAKLNLALHVTGRRPDGYHLIESVVVFADYADVVTAEPSSDGRMRLCVKGPFAPTLTDSTQPGDNLAIRAASALAQAAGKSPPPTKLTLTKRIPIAAGLGGGSADAAATLRLLDRQWNLNLGPAKLAEIGVKLGADVPMCLASRPLIARGIGDMITPIPMMPAMPIVLANPNVAISTSAVFAGLSGKEGPSLPPPPARLRTLLDVIFWLRQSRNDLADPAMIINKSACAAAKALTRDPECLFARMSGSGASAFGIFASMEAAERAAARLRDDKPRWWIAPAMTQAA